MALVEESSQDLLQAYVELWHQSLCYAKSMALAVALDLRIPDAIHHHGGGATLPQILAQTALHPNKLRALRSLMRMLTVFGTFSVQQPPTSGDDSTVDASGEAVYRLTAASRFLVSDEVSSATLASFVSLALHQIAVAPHTVAMCAWFRQEQNEPSAYALAFRQPTPTIWQHADDVNALLNKGMVQDSRFLLPIVLRECGEVFRGIDSLVDVAVGMVAPAPSSPLPSRTSSAACLTSRTLSLVLHLMATCSLSQAICLRVFHLQPLFSSR
jgi:hypothetical protein